MREDRLSAHRFRWIAGLLVAVIGLLLWQNRELNRLHNHVEEAVATAEDASEYARRAWDAAAKNPSNPRLIPLTAPRGHTLPMGRRLDH